MDREGFRNRLKQYKKAREENPGLKYWEWKDIPKYDEGTNSVTLKEKEDAFWRGDTLKMAELVEREGKQLTYNTPESNLDEIVVTANRPKQNQYSELDFAKDIVGFTPIGDVIDLYDAGKALYKGNYSEAAILGAGLLLPNWLEKSGKYLKRIWNGNGKELINYSSSNAVPRSTRDINKDLFHSQKDIHNYLESDEVQKRINRADNKYGTQYKKYSDFIVDRINKAQPNVDYFDPLFIPSEIKQNGGFGGGYDPMTRSFYFSPLMKNKSSVSHTLHHETLHFLDDVASNDLGLDRNSFLNVDYFSLNRKNLPQLFFDYGLKNIITHPINTAKNALNDAYYLSRPTEIRAYFSDKIFKPRFEQNISFGRPFTKEELSNRIIKHIVLSQKNNKRNQFLSDINKYGFAEGGQVEPDPLEVLERSKPKFHGIPLAKGNIDGVFSPIDIPLATLPKVWPAVNKWLPNYGHTLGALIVGDNGQSVNKSAKPIATKRIEPDVEEFYRDIVIPLRPQEDYVKNIYLNRPGTFKYNVYPDDALPSNRVAEYNPITGEIRVKESMLNSPQLDQTLAHDGSHDLEKLLRTKEAQDIIDEALIALKNPISKESNLIQEKGAEVTRMGYNAFKYMKDHGLMQVKNPLAKTEAYQNYVLNATLEQLAEMMGDFTAYSRDYKAGKIDYDKIRWALAYAPEIAVGLIVPQHLLNSNKEEKQWT